MEMKDVEEYSIDDPEDYTEEKPKRPLIRTPVDLQRLKVEKLMKNPDKPIIIPETPKEKDFMLSVPTFVRNVMGSSAGAGSGEFHVYRHLRRKEYARQKYIQAKSIREQLDDDYHSKLEKNKLDSEAKTAKKRAKRLKKKQKAQDKGKKPRIENENSSSAPNDNDSTTDSENDVNEISNDVQKEQEDDTAAMEKPAEKEITDIKTEDAKKPLVESEIIESENEKDESNQSEASDPNTEKEPVQLAECSPCEVKNQNKESCNRDLEADKLC